MLSEPQQAKCPSCGKMIQEIAVAALPTKLANHYVGSVPFKHVFAATCPICRTILTLIPEYPKARQ